MPGPKLKIPYADGYPEKHIGVFCSARRILGLYKEGTNITAERISKTVKAWFTKEVKKHGWAGCHFVPQIQSNQLGAILWNPLAVKISAAKIAISRSKSA